MVESKYSTKTVTTRGSEALKGLLQRGDIQKIADRFGLPYSRVFAIIQGKHASSSKIVECAEKLVALYDAVDLEKKRTEILKSYGDVN